MVFADALKCFAESKFMLMHPRNLKHVLTITLLAAATAAHSAVILESFEADPLLAPGSPAANPPYTNISRSATGVTQGSSSMQIGFSDGTFSWLYMAQPSKTDSYYPAYGKWYAHSKVKLDVYRPPQPIGWNFNMAMAINNQGGWQQIDLLPSWPWLNAGESSTQTLSWDYSAIRNANTPGGFWLQLVLSAHGSFGGTAYIDNVRFTDAVDIGFTFPTNSSGGDLQNWTPQGWGTALAATYWDPADAQTNSSSGSMYCFCDFATATTNQTAVFQVWNLGLDSTEYAKLAFDVKVDGSTSFPTTTGDFGYLQPVLRGSDIDWNPFGPFLIPGSASNSFVHFEVPLYQPLPTNMLGLDLIFGTTNFQGAVNYYVDNVMLIVDTNSPVLTMDKALPGLEISTAGTATDQRQSIRTATGNYNWTSAAGAVTYSMNINEGLSAQSAGMVAYMFLVGTTNANPSAAADYNEANGMFLEIAQQANGLCTAGLLYKTNSPNSNGIRYTPAGVLGVVSNVPMAGQWSVTLNQNNFSVSTPGGGSASGTLPAGVLSQFTTNVYAFFGVQPNQTSNLGKFIDLARVQITGVASPIDQNFTIQNTLNTSVLVARAANTNGVLMRPSNIAYRFSWPAPPSAHLLRSAASVLGPWNDPGVPLVTAGSRNIAFLPSAALPSSGAGFFRLQNP